MDTLLAVNDTAALVGVTEGRVETVVNTQQLTPSEWRRTLHSRYREPEHWYPDEEGAPFTHHTGGYWHDDKGNMIVEVLEGTKPYEVFEDNAYGLSVRAAFLPNVHWWVLADRKRDPPC